MSTAQITTVDPSTLTIETNVRTAATLDKDFLSSIKQHGVLTPVLVMRNQDGALAVRAGQRRTLAAVEVGLPTIPAYVLAHDDEDQARRIIEQMAENDHRAPLTTAERATAMQTLEGLGLSAAQIAKRTATKRAEVDKGLKVAASQAATDAAATHDLTLDQALVLAEFDDDPDVVEALTAVAVKEPERFPHVAQRLRDERDRARKIAQATEELTVQGITVLDRAPLYDDKTTKHLRELRRADAEPGTPALTLEDVRECPGLAAHVTTSWSGEVDVAYYIRDYAKHGYADRYATGTGQTTGPMTDEQKAERRQIIENNKAWRSAEKVRREWLRTFAARKTAPKDGPGFITQAIATRSGDLDRAQTKAHSLARDLLGIDQSTGYGDTTLTDTIAKASPARAQVIALVLILAAIEDTTDVHTWRNKRDGDYFAALTRWGYTLSDVEALTIPTKA